MGSVFEVEFGLLSCWNDFPIQTHPPEPRAFHPVANAMGLEVSAATEQAGLALSAQLRRNWSWLLKESHWHSGLKKAVHRGKE